MAPSVLLKQYTTTTKVLQNSNNKASQGTDSITLALMAKTRKFTKSHHSTSGLVPGSSAPKRKSTTDNNLNLDRNSMLGIPTRVYSILNMSVSERKELQINLQRELEELRIVERKYLSCNYSNGGVHSSSRIAPNIKHSMFTRGETGRHDASSIPASSDFNSSLMKQCEELLKYLMNHKNGYAFREPVDPVKLRIPDYFTIISHPMDFGTVMKKLKSGAYRSPWGFASDVRLTLVNAKTYNPSGNPFHNLANSMSKLFESKFKAIETKMATEVAMEREEAHSMLQAKRRKLLSKNPHPSLLPLVVPSPTEKVEIKNESLDGDRLHVQRILMLLEDDLPEHVQDFLRRESIAADQQPCGNEIEVDVNSFNHVVILQLKKLLNEHLDYLKSAANQKKEDHCVLEMLNESGVSNSLIPPPCKVNEPDEEDVDVDIGGNDPPMIAYPPIEIEKEKDVRNGRFSGGSSSSSSGVSSSSSSDSDSANSSDSESENANDFPPACSNKEDIQHVVTPNHGNCDFLNPNDANNQFDQRIQSKATLLAEDAAVQQEILGENGLCERQVSPEKLIRAALLKNRFADTILKFREPFDKVENGNPEKLRHEKEEYERQKKRDKARIQAEAKAAEEACRQYEAAMAAEAKIKREAEREAARQALLRVEKTVEINGSSEFLNDLEILQTVSAPGGEHQHQLIASSINDTSFDPSQDCIGDRFMLGGNNPLEKLGLYMKEDEEEEENENFDVAIVDRVDPSNNSHIIDDNGSINDNSTNKDNIINNNGSTSNNEGTNNNDYTNNNIGIKNNNSTNRSSINNSSDAGCGEVGEVDR